jgi:hypothetical protein
LRARRHGLLGSGGAGWTALGALLALSAGVGCAGTVGGGDRDVDAVPPPGEGPEAVVKLVMAGGAITGVELVKFQPEGLPTFYQRLGDVGTVHVEVSDLAGKLRFDGWVEDPRRVVMERFDATGIGGDELRIDDGELVLVLPVLGDGHLLVTVTLPADVPDAAPESRTFELGVFATASRLGTARGALVGETDFRYVAGPVSPSGDIEYVLFVANSYADKEVFFATASRLASEWQGQDWYDGHTDRFTFYALYDTLTNAIAAPPGGSDAASGILATARVEAIATSGWSAAPLGVGTVFPRLPDLVVAVPDVDFRPFAIGTNVGLPGIGGYSQGYVLAHEMGHAFGGLGDEYPEPGRGWPWCWVGFPNVATSSPPPWECVTAGIPYEETCADGSTVGVYGRVLDCDNLARPCPHCMMMDYQVFCPVCRARMDAKLNERMGTLPGTDACNGVDDDLDGQVDEGCLCVPTTPPPAASCGAGCDYCWLGTAYENACLPGWNGDGTCDCGCQYSDTDCGTPPPPIPSCGNGACEPASGEDCASCATDCGVCTPPPTGSCPSGDGLYCGSTVGLTGGTLYYCASGSYSVSEVCANGCHVSPPGTADYCEPATPPPSAPCGDGSCDGGGGETCSSCPADCGMCPPPPTGCPSGDGWYCGSSVGLDGATLYYCAGGSYSFDQYCSGGCVVMPPGVPDVCGAGSCPSGDGWYCGGSVGLDGGTLYYCTSGAYSVAQYCTAGCVIAPPGVADYCG